jgi:hypothetical protein
VIAAGPDFARMRDYIGGRLSDDERQAFEDRLVRDPELVRELEESLRLRDGLQQLSMQGYFARAALRGRSLRLWQSALAAAAVAGLALFLWGQRETRPPPLFLSSLESRGAPAVAPLVSAHFTFVSVRGTSTPDLDLPAAGWIEIRAAPNARATGLRYRVTLMRRDQLGSDKPVGLLTSVVLSSDGYVHSFVDATRLRAGSYLLRIEPARTDTGADIAQFPFNLAAAGKQPAR